MPGGSFSLSHGESLAGLSSTSQKLHFLSPRSPLIKPPSFTHLKNTHKLRHSSGLVVWAGDSNGSPSATTSISVVPDVDRKARRHADWNTARELKASGSIHVVKVVGWNSGGLIVRFHSLLGFLPFTQLSPANLCKEPRKTSNIRTVAASMIDSLISVKVVAAQEEKRNLIFSEKEVAWDKYSKSVKVGDVFEGRVGLVDDYGAFVHLRFPDVTSENYLETIRDVSHHWTSTSFGGFMGFCSRCQRCLD
ncbi:30S ribosomal protein S1, chloroplastic [Linum grandiflorum]